MANFFHGQGWSTLAWNFRGCSEEINRQLIFYHSGSTNDLQTIINHVRTSCQFQKLFLLGFSLGGNLILKYLGEQGAGLPGNIFKAVCFSVPLNLHQSCERISRGVNRIYSHRFLKKLKKKVLQKAKKYPDNFDLKSLGEVRRLIDFDDRFTAPIHGFENAIDYYQRCSSINYLEDITIPTLIVNARNDPFLSGSCFPVDKLANHDFVELLTPSNGGHCGFADREFKNGYWSEVLAWNYLNWV